MSERERKEQAPGGPEVPRGWVRHPHERMLITPLMAGVGGLLAFFTVVAIVVWLPIHTFDPPPSGDWAPLASPGRSGGALLPLPEDLGSGRLLGLRSVAQPARDRAHRP